MQTYLSQPFNLVSKMHVLFIEYMKHLGEERGDLAGKAGH